MTCKRKDCKAALDSLLSAFDNQHAQIADLTKQLADARARIPAEPAIDHEEMRDTLIEAIVDLSVAVRNLSKGQP